MATKAFSKKEYTGPISKRRVVDGKADVSKEELDDFKRKYGSDKTLRDLLNADRTGKLPEPVGAYRSRRAEAAPSEAKKEAPKPVKAAPRASAASEEESGMSKRLRSAGLTAKGAEEAGGLGSSVLAALGMAGGAGANVARAAKAKKAAEAAKTAAKEFSKPSAAQVSKETGRRFTAKEEMEAATSAAKGAAARKPIQAARKAREAKEAEEVATSTARGAATRKQLAEKREKLALDYQKMLDKYASKKSSPRDRTREKAEYEFSKGGMAKKGKK